MTFDYHMPLYRPPSEGNNLIIQATLGCSFNRCSFCSMYRQKRYRARSLDEVFDEIEQAARAWPEAQRVFLADGDAFGLPADHLLKLLERLRRALPRLARVSCYATPANIRRKSGDELKQLRDAGLSLLYIGIETGDPRLLRRITKGATPRTIAAALQAVAAAHFKVSATVILGLGGARHWQSHIDATAALLSLAPVSYLSTLQLSLDPLIRDRFLAKFAEPFVVQDDRAILFEQQRLIECLDPPAALFFRSNHASNALALAGNLPRDRQRLLALLERALRGDQPLRPAYLRQL